MLKRLFDIIIAICGLIFFFPFFLLLIILIKLDSKGPAFFLQERIGRFNVPFKLIKFRSMHVNSERQGLLTSGSNDARITRVGYYIRKFHLDEFAQLINVLLNDMSIVGPRPEIPKYTRHYKRDWQKVLSVKPGITGLTQIKYADQEYLILAHSKNRDSVYIKSILPKKLKYDKYYIKHLSLCFDIKIILLTVKKYFS